MGKRVGVSGTTWQNYELENAAPNAHVLAHLSGEGFDMNWVLTGQGEMRKSAAAVRGPDRGFAERGQPGLARDEAGSHIFVPRYALHIVESASGTRNAGGGTLDSSTRLLSGGTSSRPN